MNNLTPDLERIVDKILASTKYRNATYLDETIRNLVISESQIIQNEAKLEKSVRKKLHNIVASYLGDPNYKEAEEIITAAITTSNEKNIKKACIDIMNFHLSTRERIPILDEIYPEIFTITGKPRSILDLACGLHPLSIPWMGLQKNTSYYAYDIHLERVDFINHFLTALEMEPLAVKKDILAAFPKETGDIAFILKEVHRFEQRKKGVSLDIITNLRVNYVVISFPIMSISGQFNLLGSYENLLEKILRFKSWHFEKLVFKTEVFFIIKKV